MGLKTAARAGEIPAQHCTASSVLISTSGELSAAAATCDDLQWAVSAVLERAHHPDLPAELQMLQEIDRLQQTLLDIAQLVRTLAKKTDGILLSRQDLASGLKLDSLTARLFDQPPGTETRSGPSQDTSESQNEEDVTWL